MIIPVLTPVEWAIIIGAVISTITLLIVFLDFWITHLKTKRSSVNIDEYEQKEADLTRGNETRYLGSVYYKISNSGERSAVISDIDIELTDLIGSHDKEKVEFDNRMAGDVNVNSELKPESTYRISPTFEIEASDFRVLLESKEATVRVTLGIEDNIGAYDSSQESVVKLSGPKEQVDKAIEEANIE